MDIKLQGVCIQYTEIFKNTYGWFIRSFEKISEFLAKTHWAHVSLHLLNIKLILIAKIIYCIYVIGSQTNFINDLKKVEH